MLPNTENYFKEKNLEELFFLIRNASGPESYSAAVEIRRRLQEKPAPKGEGSSERLRKAARDLLEYRERAGPLNFQLEKADDYLREIAAALEPGGEQGSCGS